MGTIPKLPGEVSITPAEPNLGDLSPPEIDIERRQEKIYKSDESFIRAPNPWPEPPGEVMQAPDPWPEPPRDPGDEGTKGSSKITHITRK